MPRWYTSPFDHVRYALVTSQGQLDQLIAGKTFMDTQSAAQTLITTLHGQHSCIVQIPLDGNRSSHVTSALLVHEAVHIWQEVRSRMGEQQPSPEFEAYSIQRVSQDLICTYGTQLCSL